MGGGEVRGHHQLGHGPTARHTAYQCQLPLCVPSPHHPSEAGIARHQGPVECCARAERLGSGRDQGKPGTNESAKIGLFYVQNTDCSFPEGGIPDPYLRPRLPKINPWPAYQFNLKDCMESARSPNVQKDPTQAGALIKVNGIPGFTEEVMCVYPAMKGYMFLDQLGDKTGIAKYALRAKLSTDGKKNWRPIENFVTFEEMGLTETTGFSYVKLAKVEAVLAEQMPNMDPPEVPEVQLPVEVGIIGKNFSAVQLTPNTGVLDWEVGATKTGEQIAKEDG